MKLIISIIQQIGNFIKVIPSFYKYYCDYEYDGNCTEFIVENYCRVLEERTILMSKPTYHYKDVIEQIDKWYDRYSDSWDDLK